MSYADRFQDLRTRARGRDSLRYPEPFRADAIELVDELRADGWTQKRISEALEIPWTTVARWQTQAGEDSDKRDGFRPVEVVGSRSGPDGIAVAAPDGWRIEGLTLEQAIGALRRLQ